MNTLRRNVLKGASSASAVAVAIAAGLLKPTVVLAAWNKSAFEAKNMDEAMKDLSIARWTAKASPLKLQTLLKMARLFLSKSQAHSLAPPILPFLLKRTAHR
jgi:hypothetical protein